MTSMLVREALRQGTAADIEDVAGGLLGADLGNFLRATSPWSWRRDGAEPGTRRSGSKIFIMGRFSL